MKKIIISLAAGAFLLAGCSSATQAPVTEASPTEAPATDAQLMPPTESSPTPESAMKSENAKIFTVTGKNFSFDVKEMKVKKGDTVTVTFKNEDGFHDWRVDEFNAATKQIPAGKEDTVTFIADKTGTFEYYCSVGQHRKNGMVGKLIVE
ncbi:MAG: cupredoxin domain-containing protein [Candidatus Woesebacteria bacterium]